jgi:sporulation-control protein spo0M
MDHKAALIVGLCIILASLLVVIALGWLPQAGRYQMTATSGVNVFLLDTQTGRVWSRVVRPNEGSTGWIEEAAVPWRHE